MGVWNEFNRLPGIRMAWLTVDSQRTTKKKQNKAEQRQTHRTKTNEKPHVHINIKYTLKMREILAIRWGEEEEEEKRQQNGNGNRNGKTSNKKLLHKIFFCSVFTN